MPVPKKFPSDAEVNRVSTEHRFYSLYKSNVFDFDNASSNKRAKFLLEEFFANDKEKAKLLSLALNIAPSIVRAGANFLFGKRVKIEVAEAAEQEAGDETDDAGETEPPLQKAVDRIIRLNKLHKKLKASARMLQAVGHTQFKFSKQIAVDGNPVAIIEEIPFDCYFPSFDQVLAGRDPSTYFVASYLTKDPGDGTPAQKFIYIEEHTVEVQTAEQGTTRKGVIRYSLYKDQNGKIGEQVPLDTLAGLQPSNATADADNQLTLVQQTGLDEVTILELDADKDVKDQLPDSILKQIEPALNQINLTLTQIALQMLKHLDPLLEIPATSIPINPDGTVDRKKLEILFTQVGDMPSRYVTNDNPLIEESFKLLVSLILGCAKLTDTPPGFIWEDEKGGVESAESIKARFMLFLKRIDNYREEYDDGIRAMLIKALKIQGITVPEDAEVKNRFDFGLPRDLEVDGKVWGQAALDGIASFETAVRNFQDLEGDLLDEEMARIKKDQELVPPINLTQPVGAGGTPAKAPTPGKPAKPAPKPKK